MRSSSRRHDIVRLTLIVLTSSVSGLGPLRGRDGCETTTIAPDVAPHVAPGPVVGWTSRATRVLASDHYSFRAVMRRVAPGAGCLPFELVIANGYDHVPQYLARIDMLPGRACGPERTPRRWSAHALHHADVAVADVDHDGLDELVVATFAGADGRMHQGKVTWLSGDGTEATILSGVAAASLAVGDVDADGDLDIVVGTVTAVAPGANGRDVKHVHGDELDGPTWLLLGPDFATHEPVPGRGALDVHLADVDLDGAVDVVSAGPSVTIVFGPAPWDVLELELPHERGQPVTPAVDVAWSTDGGHALIAATAGCMSGEECVARLGDMAVVVWRVGTARAVGDLAPRQAELAAWWPVAGVPGPARFVFVDEDDVVDVIVGVMSEPGAPVPVVGRPWLGPAGLIGGAPLIRRGGAASDDLTWEPLAITTPGPARPMATSIGVWGDPRAATIITTREDPGAVITWTGRGEVVGATAEIDGATVAVTHVPGDAHVYVPTGERRGPITVAWQVVQRPHLIITSACPVPGEAAGTLFVEHPIRARSTRTNNEEK